MVLTGLSLSEDDGGPVHAVGLGCGVRAAVVLPPDELLEEPPALVVVPEPALPPELEPQPLATAQSTRARTMMATTAATSAARRRRR